MKFILSTSSGKSKGKAGAATAGPAPKAAASDTPLPAPVRAAPALWQQFTLSPLPPVQVQPQAKIECRQRPQKVAFLKLLQSSPSKAEYRSPSYKMILFSRILALTPCSP